MEFRQYIKILRKYLWMILLICLIGAISTLYFSLQQAPLYRASTTLALNPASPISLTPFSPTSRAQELVPTYIEFLKSRSFASQVVKELNLDGVNEDAVLRSISAEGIINTQLLRINALSPRPEYAQLFANAVAKVFIQLNVAQQKAQAAQTNGQDVDMAALEQQRLEDLRTRLEDENTYYSTLIPTLRKRITELQALPSSLDGDKKVLDLQTQLTQAQDLNVKVLASLSDVQSKLAGGSATGAGFNTAVVIDEARLPLAPEPSRTPLNMLFALVASFVLGFGGAVFIEYLDYTIKTPEQLDADYAMPTLGVIGLLDAKAGIKSRQERLVSIYHPKSPASEAYRSLRTNVQFAAASQPIRSLLVTSAGPGEGKSMTAANLAVSFAQVGQRVILVDLDLRRPSQHRLFELPNQRGFTNLLLSAESGALDYLQSTAVEGLKVLTSGPLPPNPAEILSSAAAAGIMQQLGAAADLVIYDTPPAVTVTDAVVLARRVDAIIQIVAAGATRRDLVLRGRDVLQRTGQRMLGPVLNKVKLADLGYYYYYYYHYYNQPAPARSSALRGLFQRSRNGHLPANAHGPNGNGANAGALEAESNRRSDRQS